VHNSEAYRHFEILHGYNDLVKTVSSLMKSHADFTKLTPNLLGIDPDDAFSKIPYEKGSLFLLFLERMINDLDHGAFRQKGKLGMQQWLKTYYTHFRAKSVTVKQVQEHFLHFFQSTGGLNGDTIGKLRAAWDTWLVEPGMPKYNPNEDKAIDRSLVVGCEKLANMWLDGGQHATADDLHSFSSKQKMYFLDVLLTHKRHPNPFAGGGDAKAAANPLLTKLDHLYGLSKSANVEISFRFLMLCVTNGHRGALPVAADFLSRHGRGLYVKPLYKALADLDKEYARNIYAKNKSFYHSIIQHFCEDLLK